MADSEGRQLLEMALEEGRLCDILGIARSCGSLESELEERINEAVSQHKENLIDYLNNLWSEEKRNCKAGLALSYGVLGLIDNFEGVYGLGENVKISKKKEVLLRRIKKKNFKKPPEGLNLGLVPRGLTRRNSRFAQGYKQKIEGKLLPKIAEELGLGEEQKSYLLERAEELLQALPLLRYQ